METTFEFLSGKVPGGIILVLALLLSVHLLLSFLKSSGLMSKQRVRKDRILYTVVILLVYLSIWLATRPPRPPVRLAVLPTADNRTLVRAKARNYYFPEYFRRNTFHHLKDKYFIHRWQWLYETIGPDSASSYPLWPKVARLVGAQIILTSTFSDSGIRFTLHHISGNQDQTEETQIHSLADSRKILTWLSEKTDLFRDSPLPDKDVNETFLQGELALLQKRYRQILLLADDNPSPDLRVLKAAALVHIGMQRKIDRQKVEYLESEIKIPEFEQARRILAELIRQRLDTPDVAYWLGRMAIFTEDFGKAEIFLKKALADDPTNSRIHYRLSFLLPQRLRDLGYKNRIELLKKAVYLDPGYRDAVYALAHEYYVSGTGTPSGLGTTMAMKTIQNFLKIRRGDARMLSLLGSISLKISDYDQAERIFKLMLQRYPNDSNAHYNMGVVQFMLKHYKKALPYFLQAIKIDHNLDAYLYAGITYRLLGNNRLALKYYRERVKRKTGDDDSYAKEAMKGIRVILADSLTKKQHEK